MSMLKFFLRRVGPALTNPISSRCSRRSRPAALLKALLSAAALSAGSAWSDAYYMAGGGEADYEGGSDTVYHFGVGLGLSDRLNIELKYVDYGSVEGQGDAGLVYSLMSEWPFSNSNEAALIVEIGGDGTDPFLAAGILFHLSSSLALTAEYEIHEIDDYEFSAIVISARFTNF